MFIVLEGIDGSGKTTQLNKIKEYVAKEFPNKDIIFTREPGGLDNHIGEELREVILNNEMDDYTRALLYAASRYEHQLKIKEWIADNKIVICDRYIYSSLAYNSNNISEMNEILNINRYNDIIKPNAILFYRINMDIYNERKRNRSNERELDALEQKPDSFFIKSSKFYTTAFNLTKANVIEINSNRSIEEVTSDTLEIIDNLLREE